jgi:hypothetical protein
MCGEWKRLRQTCQNRQLILQPPHIAANGPLTEVLPAAMCLSAGA